jgi:hypothetical protein
MVDLPVAFEQLVSWSAWLRPQEDREVIRHLIGELLSSVSLVGEEFLYVRVVNMESLRLRPRW